MADAKRKGRNSAQVAKRAKLVVLPLTMMPLAIALVRYFTDQFGVDAIGDFTLDTGNWGIRLLLATLAVTPIRELTGWNWLITYRRPLGLASFYYLCVHLLVYAYLDFALNLEFILIDVTESIFIVVGVAGFLLLIPLAITSTTGWIRPLGQALADAAPARVRRAHPGCRALPSSGQGNNLPACGVHGCRRAPARLPHRRAIAEACRRREVVGAQSPGSDHTAPGRTLTRKGENHLDKPSTHRGASPRGGRSP